MSHLLLSTYCFFLFFLDSAKLEFISTPSNPWKVLEGQNITFEWRYTLDGTYWMALFGSITGNARNVIASNSGGSTTVDSNFKKRFIVDIAVTQAKITVLAVQMSDDRRKILFKLYTNYGLIVDEVELIVQCK